MRVISDTSPLILLATIGQLDLLRQLFGTIVIPHAVQREIGVRSPSDASAVAIHSASWITVMPLAVPLHPETSSLHAGEAEAITLASQQSDDVLLIVDDLRARTVAQRIELPITGSAGILVAAKDNGLIPVVRPHLNALRHAGLHMGQALYDHVLQRAGEAEPDGDNE